MSWFVVDWRICQGCEPCLARIACKTRAIVQFEAGEQAIVDVHRCRGCGDCLPACTYSAISIKNLLPDEPDSRSKNI